MCTEGLQHGGLMELVAFAFANFMYDTDTI